MTSFSRMKCKEHCGIFRSLQWIDIRICTVLMYAILRAPSYEIQHIRISARFIPLHPRDYFIPLLYHRLQKVSTNKQRLFDLKEIFFHAFFLSVFIFAMHPRSPVCLFHFTARKFPSLAERLRNQIPLDVRLHILFSCKWDYILFTKLSNPLYTWVNSNQTYKYPSLYHRFTYLLSIAYVHRCLLLPYRLTNQNFVLFFGLLRLTCFLNVVWMFIFCCFML